MAYVYDKPGTIIPAAPGYSVHPIDWPRLDDMLDHPLPSPVVAWEIGPDGAWPIIPLGELPERQQFLLELPNGTVQHFLDMATFETLQGAVEYLKTLRAS